MTNLLQQAVDAHQSGNLNEAEKLYQSVLEQQPQQPDALALLGVVLAMKGETARAIELIEQAIQRDPTSALFKFHLGNVLMDAKKLPQAIVAFRQAIKLQPNFAQAYFNMGNALRAADDWPGAAAAYKKTIQHNPVYAEAYNNLAHTLVHEKEYDEALSMAKKAVEIAPNYGDGWLTLCNVAEHVKDYPLAVKAGEYNIKLQPDNHRAWFGYGIALNRVDRHEEALAMYKRSLELNPERADIWDNLAQTYQSLNRLEEGEATFRKVIEVAGQVIPDEDQREVDESEYGNRHWHLALMELLRGKYAQGFARYRSRFKNVEGLTRPNFSRPLWKGEDINGKTILITDEQGFGDTLMLARYLPLVKARGAKIIFSLHPVLKPLFEGSEYIDTIIIHGEGVPAYDMYASVFDLPYHFKTTYATIPANVPYLPKLAPTADTQLAKTDKPKVGVVWGGNPLHKNDSRRSVPLTLFAELFKNEKLQFFSLNRDVKPGDVDLLAQYPVVDLAPRLKTFADGARFIDQMDLVLTVDTATAHLAGGLGNKTWTLLPFAPDWRWLIDREDTGWYPTMRLFRQKEIGNWADVIKRVARALQEM